MTDRPLYDLLPAIHRLRDAERGAPLRDLFEVVEEVLAQLEVDNRQLYDDLFVETCADWLVDSFADLVGVQLAPTQDARSATTGMATRRRLLVNALRDRRRKGTLAALESAATDASGWVVRAAEDRLRAAVGASASFPGLPPRRSLDLRDGDRLADAAAAFGGAACLADVRRGGSRRSRPAGPNLTTVSVTAWRLAVEAVTLAPALCVNDDNEFTFDPLGRAQALAVAPTVRRPGRVPAADLDLPVPISRVQMERHLEDHYGPTRSICVYRGDEPVARDEIVVADLGHWHLEPDHDHVALDPETGRIVFPRRHVPDGGVWVHYHHLSVAPLGSGRDPRAPGDARTSTARLTHLRVAGDGTADHTSVGAALRAWRTAAREPAATGALAPPDRPDPTPDPTHAVIEIVDDGIYEEAFDIRLSAGESLEVRAAPGRRPLLRAVDEEHNRPRRVRVTGPEPQEPRGAASEDEAEDGYDAPAGDHEPPASNAPAPTLVLDGLWIAGHPVELAGALGAVEVRHCTLVPAVRPPETSGGHDSPETAPSVIVATMPDALTISSSIVGPVHVRTLEAGVDAAPLVLRDTIVDAGRRADEAVSGPEGRAAYVRLSVERATILGRTAVHEIADAVDTLFTGRVSTAIRQRGTVSHCYVPPDSTTPRRTDCQPDGVIAPVDEALARREILPADADRRRRQETARVRPQLSSVAFGTSTYARLDDGDAAELRRGAHDEGELGAYHDLWLDRRADDLQTQVREFTPIGVDVEIVFAN